MSPHRHHRPPRQVGPDAAHSPRRGTGPGGAHSPHLGVRPGGEHSPHLATDREAVEHHHEPDPSQPPPSPSQPQQLSGEAQRRLRAARLWIAANRPYYSKAVFSCPIVPTAAPMRLGIDEGWRIYASSEHLESLTVEGVAVELIHAVNHVLRDHAQRARNTGVNADTAVVWNVAADCEINDDLYYDDLLDDTCLLPEIFGLDDCLPAERYWRHLRDNSTVIEVHTDCGSGSHSQHLPHELDDGDTPALADLDQTLLRHAVATAVNEHRKHHGVDSVPEGLQRWANQTLHPQVNWQQQLAAAVRTAAHHKTGTADFTWQRPSRRQQAQDPVLRPALTRPTPAITVVVDTSGSMSQRELGQAVAEIKAIITTVTPGDSIRVLSVDIEVHTDQHIHNPNHIILTGAGGTNMATGITTAAENNPDAIIVITDGWTPWPQTPPTGARTVIAAFTDHHCIDQVPQWIQTIDITDHPPA